MPRESCFENAEYDIMRQCWEWQRRKRPTLADLKEKLEKLHEHAANSGNLYFFYGSAENGTRKAILSRLISSERVVLGRGIHVEQ